MSCAESYIKQTRSWRWNILMLVMSATLCSLLQGYRPSNNFPPQSNENCNYVMQITYILVFHTQTGTYCDAVPNCSTKNWRGHKEHSWWCRLTYVEESLTMPVSSSFLIEPLMNVSYRGNKRDVSAIYVKCQTCDLTGMSNLCLQTKNKTEIKHTHNYIEMQQHKATCTSKHEIH